MARKKHSAEQIVAILRQIEVEVANHKPTGQACREAGITEQTYYRWRKEYGGLKLEQARRRKELEKENARLRRLVTELSLEKQVLKDVAEGIFLALNGGVARSGMHASSIGCRSGMPAGCWGSGEGRSDTSRLSATMKTR